MHTNVQVKYVIYKMLAAPGRTQVSAHQRRVFWEEQVTPHCVQSDGDVPDDWQRALSLNQNHCLDFHALCENLRVECVTRLSPAKASRLMAKILPRSRRTFRAAAFSRSASCLALVAVETASSGSSGNDLSSSSSSSPNDPSSSSSSSSSSPSSAAVAVSSSSSSS